MTSREFQYAFAKHQDDIVENNNFEPVVRNLSFGSWYNDGNKYVRPPFGREHYEYFRPNDKIPTGSSQEDLHQIMVLCGKAYEQVGIVKIIVDVIAEFAAEGIEIVHEDESPNKFYQSWQQKVNLESVVEQFIRWLGKSGNTVVRRKYGQIDSSRIKQLRENNKGDGVKYGYIPLEYKFYNPASVDVVGDGLSLFSDTKMYGLRISAKILQNLKQPKTDAERKIFNSLPPEIQNLIKSKNLLKGHYVVPIDNDKIYIGHYKKDDNDIWAKSFIYSVLSDIQYNQKLKLAKITTLDGMINVTRLWKLGDHTHELLPSPGAGAKLAGIISNNTGSGPVDIIWDSAIDLKEYYPPIENLVHFQEDTKSILMGLGFPEGLLGGSDSTGNANANALSLKNFIKILEAVRREVRKWLNAEIDIIQERMGFGKRPIIRFSNSDLYDTSVYFKLLIDLVDRNILSEGRVLEIIGENPGLENLNIMRKEEMRKEGTAPDRAGPYYNPQLKDQQKHEINKQKLQNNSNNMSKENPTRKSDNGRPKNSKDNIKRVRRTNAIQASRIYDFTQEYVTKLMLDHFKVANARQLTNDQKKIIESSIIEIMALFPSNSEPSEESILNAYENGDQNRISKLNSIYRELLYSANAENITADEKRISIIEAYMELENVD